MKGKTRKELKIYKIRCIKLFILGLLVCIISAFAFEYAIYCTTLSCIRMDYVLTEEQENAIVPFHRYILERYSRVIENGK